MSTIDKPVNAIVHTGEKRAILPTTELAGEETEVDNCVYGFVYGAHNS